MLLLNVFSRSRLLPAPWLSHEANRETAFLPKVLLFWVISQIAQHALGSLEIPTRLQFSPDKTLFRALSI